MQKTRPSTARHLTLDTTNWFTPTSFWPTVLGPGLSVLTALTILIVGIAFDLDANTTGALLTIIVFGSIALWLVYVSFWGRARRTTLDRVRALTNFARERGLIYESEQPAPGILISILGRRPGVVVYDCLTSTHPREMSMGTYERTTKPGRAGFMEDWGYLAIRLNRKIPSIVLESRASRSMAADTGLLGTPHGNQRLSLEGDFDKHFRLFCPAGYEKDALYIFTPDLMALLIDEAGDLSAQFTDDVALFFSAKPFDLSDEQLRDRLLRIADVVGDKALSRTSRYSDDRSAEVDAVADAGRRLSSKIPRWPTLVVWYSTKVLLALGLALAVIVIRLGFDPQQWTAISYTSWW